uniref:Uncharacterized protein n=1 Tax=Amphimedon queenslandica TaxID=400682 RepID=A0A1X7UKK5_AMPQE
SFFKITINQHPCFNSLGK